MRRALPVFAFLAYSLVAQAQVYSWKDEHGRIHYGDRPPPAQQRDARRLTGSPPVDAHAERKAFLEREMAEAEKRKAGQEQARQKQESQGEEQKRMENCRRAQANLEGIESGQIRFVMGEDGQMRGLDGKVRDAEIAKARQIVNDWCTPPKAAGK